VLIVLACATVSIVVNLHEEGAVSIKEEAQGSLSETIPEGSTVTVQLSAEGQQSSSLKPNNPTSMRGRLIDYLGRAQKVHEERTIENRRRLHEDTQALANLLGLNNPLSTAPSPLGLTGLTPPDVAERVISMQTKVVDDARAMSEELAAGMRQCISYDATVATRAAALQKVKAGSPAYKVAKAALKEAKVDARFAYDTLCSDVETSHQELIRVRKTFHEIIGAIASKKSNPAWLQHLNKFMRAAVHQLRKSFNDAKGLVLKSEYETSCKSNGKELKKKPYKPKPSAIELKMKHDEAVQKAHRKENSQKYVAAKKYGEAALKQKKLDQMKEAKAKKRSAAYKTRELKEKTAAASAHKTYEFIKVTELQSKAALKMAKRVKKQERQLRKAAKEDAAASVRQSNLASAHATRIDADENEYQNSQAELEHLAAVAPIVATQPDHTVTPLESAR